MTTNNHPAHDPVSLERLHQISEILSKAAAQSDGGNLGYAMADAVKVIDSAIAAFGAQPVLYAAEETLAYAKAGELHLKCLSQPMGDAVIPLYRHSQTAPVVPETLPCPVHLEPGLKFGKGVRTQCLMDALRRRADYYAELEAMTPEQRAEHDAGIAEFKSMLGTPAPVVPDAISTRQAISKMEECDPCDSINVAYKFGWNACRAAMLQAGNHTEQHLDMVDSGWIPVSERMPNDKEFVWCYGYFSGWTESDGFEAYYDATRKKWWTVDDEKVGKITHCMPLPAAPQQEVK